MVIKPIICIILFVFTSFFSNSFCSDNVVIMLSQNLEISMRSVSFSFSQVNVSDFFDLSRSLSVF